MTSTMNKAPTTLLTIAYVLSMFGLHGAANAQRGGDGAQPTAKPWDDDDTSDFPDDDDASSDLTMSDDDFEEEEEDTSLRGRDYAWSTVAGGYLDPTSNYSLHGYVDAVYAGASDQWTTPDPTRPGPPGQLLVPNRNNAAFQYDAALILNANAGGGDIIMELHFVSDPSGQGAAGPGGLTIAATELTVSVDLHPSLMSVAGGIFWSPFGIVNHDWLGAEALFTTMPRASSAFPTHWNERGIRINGAAAVSEQIGINYVVSVGNGIHAFDITGQRSTDLDNNKAIVGRLGLFPGFGKKLEFGISAAQGVLRESGDDTLAVENTLRYPASLEAFGLDATLEHERIYATAYYIVSRENLKPFMAGQTQPTDLIRQGATAQAVYDIDFDNWILSSIAPKMRVDWVTVDTLTANASRQRQSGLGLSAGLNLYPHKQLLRFDQYPFRAFFLSLEYHLQYERNAPELKNNRFIGRLTGRF